MAQLENEKFVIKLGGVSNHSCRLYRAVAYWAGEAWVKSLSKFIAVDLFYSLRQRNIWVGR
jgi:hypothetical protein